jgi:hypothetical protein
MSNKILANPENWFPPVDMVDRPYFIAIDNENRVYSEYTNFNLLKNVRSPENNWYEKVDKKNLQYFIIKGRCGYYWLDMQSGLIFITAQHQVSEKPLPLQKHAVALVVQNEYITDNFIRSDDEEAVSFPYKLKHLKVNEDSYSDFKLGRNPSHPIIEGMNTNGIVPEDNSHVLDVIFGWELEHPLGRITFEGVVYNRKPQFDIRLLYSLLPGMEPWEVNIKIVVWDASTNLMRHKFIDRHVKENEVVTWQEKIL